MNRRSNEIVMMLIQDNLYFEALGYLDAGLKLPLKLPTIDPSSFVDDDHFFGTPTQVMWALECMLEDGNLIAVFEVTCSHCQYVKLTEKTEEEAEGRCSGIPCASQLCRGSIMRTQEYVRCKYQINPDGWWVAK